MRPTQYPVEPGCTPSRAALMTGRYSVRSGLSAVIVGGKSNRESLISFIGEDVAAVRWRNYRIYPKQFIAAAGNPAMYGLAGARQGGNGFRAIFNIEADQREEVNTLYTALG